MNPIRSLATLAALAVVAIAAPTSASAQELTACYVPKSGTVYRIKVEGTPTKCSQNHVQFSWEAGGGSSLQIVDGPFISVQIDAGQVYEKDLVCPEGKAVSGGFYPDQNIVVEASNRTGMLNTWGFRVRHTGVAGQDLPAWVALQVICAVE
jgi:hypothetical protein